jgi:hypothetical protein
VAIWFRPADRAALAPAAAVLAVVTIVLIQVAVQHRAIGTPYPMARTAIYLLPLSLVFLMLAADALATLGRMAGRLVTAAMVLLAIASVWNGVRAANTSRALDWAHDAATPAMLEVAAGTDPRAGTVRVGVDWSYYPVARYYADRLSTGATRYEVVVLPGDGLPFDFVYGPPTLESRRGAQLRAFPETGAALYRGR